MNTAWNLSERSLTERLEEITLPAAFLFGAQDFVTPPGMGERAYMQVGTPEEDRVLEVYDRSGHFPMDTSAEAFVEDVIEVIEAHRRP